MISVGVNCFTVQLYITGYAPNGLRVKFDIESQGQSTPKFNQILTSLAQDVSASGRKCVLGSPSEINGGRKVSTLYTVIRT